MRFNFLLFYHQMTPRDCQTLAASSLGFLATRAASPLVIVQVFGNLFSRFTSLNGKQSLYVSFSVADMVHVSFFLQKIVTIQCLSVFLLHMRHDSSKTPALYKSCTYLLTYLLTYLHVLIEHSFFSLNSRSI